MNVLIRFFSLVLLGGVFAYAQVGGPGGDGAGGDGPGGGPGGGGPGGGAPSKPQPDNTAEWKDQMVAHTTASPAAAPTLPSAVYSLPATFAEILGYGYTPPPLAEASSLAVRTRYLIAAPNQKYLTIGAGGATSTTTELKSYQDILSKIVEALPETSEATEFRFESELHALYSLDADPTSGYKLLWRNNGGIAPQPTGRGYVTFQYEPATKFLKAVARKLYNLSDYSHVPDPAFSAKGWYVRFDGKDFSLVQSAAKATPLSLLKSPLNVEMPKDFNADDIPYQANLPVSIKEFVKITRADVESDRSKVLQDLNPVYLPQLSAVGLNPKTRAAAQEMLNTIVKTMAAEGSKLRYSPEFYMAARDGFLRYTLQSDDIANGTLGMNTSPYVFFTNAADSKGIHHPFMVIPAYSITDKPVRLMDVTRPPGGSGGASYGQQNNTRNATLNLYEFKIPMKDYGLVSSLAENTMVASIRSDEKYTGPADAYNISSVSGLGVGLDGVSIYPLFSNMLVSCQENGEITSSGIHVGQGMGLHWHSDGHTAVANDFNLYNMADYPGQPHPPLIGFGLDGLALYGTYEAAFPNQEGIGVPLDSFGGHSHGVYGYHYHAHTVASVSSRGTPYTNFVLIKGAWKGKINSIPDFWEPKRNGPAHAMNQRTVWVGKR